MTNFDKIKGNLIKGVIFLDLRAAAKEIYRLSVFCTDCPCYEDCPKYRESDKEWCIKNIIHWLESEVTESE